MKNSPLVGAFVKGVLPEPLFRSTQRLWRRSIQIRRDGIVNSWNRAKLYRQILTTKPIRTGAIADEMDTAVYLMCCLHDYVAAIWTLKSFYHFAGVQFPLVIHVQGEPLPAMVERLRHHFPDARLILQTEADATVLPWLKERNLKRLAAMRAKTPQMQKVTDIPSMARSSTIILLDSDVLFFRYPQELVQGDGDSSAMWFQKDCVYAYVIGLDEAEQEFGVKLTPYLNLGIVRAPRKAIDLDQCERLVSTPIFANWKNEAQLDQTLWALLACRDGKERLFPDSYVLSFEKGMSYPEMCCRHYVGPIRNLLADEGIPYLIGSGFLKAIQS